MRAMEASEPLSPAGSAAPPSQRFWSRWASGVFAWWAAMAIAAPFDLQISRSLSGQSPPLVYAVQKYGQWPGRFCAIVAVVALLFSFSRLSFSKLVASDRALRWLAVSIILLMLVDQLLITQSLKSVWGRVRFRDLDPAFANYTAFFQSAGRSAGQSFPSGHVAMALVFTPIPFFLYSLKSRWALASLLAVVAYGLLVVYGRIAAGAHYLTDCIFSFGLAWLVGSLASYWALARLHRERSNRASQVDQR